VRSRLPMLRAPVASRPVHSAIRRPRLENRSALCQGVPLQGLGEKRISIVHRVCAVEQCEIFGVDGTVADQGVKVDHLIPVLRSEEDYWQVLAHFVGLQQGQDLEQFVQRPEATGKNDHRLRQIDKPELAHTAAWTMR
jgi:hypothetical protein